MTELLRENRNRIDRVLDRVGFCANDLEKAAADPHIDDDTRTKLVDLAKALDAVGIQVAIVLEGVGIKRTPHPDHGTLAL